MSKQWSSEDVFALAASYRSACVLAAAVDFDLFVLLEGAPQTAEDVADKLRSDLRATIILLDALVALELLEKRNERYALSPGIDAVLTPHGPGSTLAMAQHHANCLRRWAQLTRVIQIGMPTDRQPSIRGHEADQAAFIEAMNDSSSLVADKVIADIQPLSFTHLLDVGGGSGTWTIAFLRASPNTTATIFDLPHVIPMARQRMSRTPMYDRVTFVGGDFLTDPLPKDADLAWLGAIVHQNSREQNRHLLSALFDALVSGGQVLIRDVLMDDAHTAPLFGALFAVNMLVNTDGGGTYSFRELRDDLEAAGFIDANILRHDDRMNTILRARKPDGI